MTSSVPAVPVDEVGSRLSRRTEGRPSVYKGPSATGGVGLAFERSRPGRAARSLTTRDAPFAPTQAPPGARDP